LVSDGEDTISQQTTSKLRITKPNERIKSGPEDPSYEFEDSGRKKAVITMP